MSCQDERSKKEINKAAETVSSDIETESIKAVIAIENVTVKNGKEHVLELYFDNHIQGQSFDLRPELPVIIHL